MENAITKDLEAHALQALVPVGLDAVARESVEFGLAVFEFFFVGRPANAEAKVDRLRRFTGHAGQLILGDAVNPQGGVDPVLFTGAVIELGGSGEQKATVAAGRRVRDTAGINADDGLAGVEQSVHRGTARCPPDRRRTRQCEPLRRAAVKKG